MKQAYECGINFFDTAERLETQVLLNAWWLESLLS
jgi:aryl-alcohol dehydrogenase-like predicted oxidoreductase